MSPSRVRTVALRCRTDAEPPPLLRGGFFVEHGGGSLFVEGKS